MNTQSWRLPVSLFGLSFLMAQIGAAADLHTAVRATQPEAYYKLDGTETALTLKGAVTFKDGAQLNGTDAYIVTPQKGGVEGHATLMAWVNFAALPGDKGHIFYVAGESQDGNDLDLQVEPGNNLRFFTAGGGSVDFTLPAAGLVGKWHMIVATMDAVNKNLSIYWDGKLARTQHIGSNPKKTSQLSIGESLVFRGRYFDGSIRDVALWGRVLSAAEVAKLWAAGTAPAKP